MISLFLNWYYDTFVHSNSFKTNVMKTIDTVILKDMNCDIKSVATMYEMVRTNIQPVNEGLPTLVC